MILTASIKEIETLRAQLEVVTLDRDTLVEELHTLQTALDERLKEATQ